ncbi:MAG: hypothetical protein COT73_12710 [Bdellovibrio sp. CG10_big_fil_rev_8_21_14_0_10_47_8]|nr:MAG: hypothetical protein COT73_12710 [Bdellovibrio sp. CG10_big_fil_rev_8_21_14_0_10_47_8]
MNCSSVCTLLLAFVVLASGCFAQAQVAESQLDKKCQINQKELETRQTTLDQLGSSLDTLLGLGNLPQVPVTVLFQIDLGNQKEVHRRIKELSALSEPVSILSSSEFKKYSECGAAVDKVLRELAVQQSAVNRRKIEFLQMAPSKRESLISAFEAKRKLQTDEFGLQKQLTSSQGALTAAQEALVKAEEGTAVQTDDDLEPILVARSSVEKYLVDLESEQIEFLQVIGQKKKLLDQLRTELAVVSNEEISPAQVSGAYKKSSDIWEAAVQLLFELFSEINLQSSPSLPNMLSGEPGTAPAKAAFASYLTAYEAAKERRKDLSDSRTKMLSDLKVQSFKLLQDGGILRAQLLRTCDARSCDRPRGLSESNIRLILLEIRVVPLRLMAGALSKWQEVRPKFSSGVDGWVDLGRQAFMLFLLMLIPWALIRSLHWASFKLDELKRNLLSKSMLDYRRRTNLAVWIARLNPFVLSVGMILSIGVARILIEGTDLRELAGFLYYFQVYYVYRLLKILLMVGLEIVFSTESVDALKQQKAQIQKSATRISRVIFIEYVLLHMTQDTVRRALAYQLFSSLIFWINVGLVIYEANRWSSKIKESFSYRFPVLWLKIARFCESRLGRVLLPLLFALVLLKDLGRWIWTYLGRLDWVKRVLSELLKKRLESADQESKALIAPPAEYLGSFDYYLSAGADIFIERHHSVIDSATEAINDWLNGKASDDLLIIVGNRGMGKTTTIDHIHQRIAVNFQSKLLKVPAKIKSSAEMFHWLSEVLSSPVSSIEDVQKFDRQLKERIVFCVDDIQNLFLGVVGGFDGYRSFLEVISLKTSHIFWCLTVNSRSWAYLKGVMGPEHFYGRVLNLVPWKDFEIQKLILTRHKITKFNRTFDESIKAYGAGDSLGQQAEAQFFRLLWGQARGNPRSALMYWISAISYPSSGLIHVGIPSFVSSSLVASMSDDALFLLSAIARHECLTHEELRLITDIENTVIRKCLKEAHDKNLIWVDDGGRVRISSRAQYVIDYFLIGKNFLYE